MTRTFIALELDQRVQSHLEQFMLEVAPRFPRFRWVKPESIHLTLAFLGDLDDITLHYAYKAVEETAREITSFTYAFEQLGFFGSAREPKVLWVGLSEPERFLHPLRVILTEKLQKRRVPFEGKFSPHFTLARIQHVLPPEERTEFRALLADPKRIQDGIDYPAQKLAVFQSELHRDGARYSMLRDYFFLEA